LLFVSSGLAVLGYVIHRRSRPVSCVPAGGPEERMLVKDEENLSGLGSIMRSLIIEFLKNPRKARLLNEINLVLAIEPVEQPETAITITFSGGYVVIEPGVAPSMDIKLVCDYETVTRMAKMGAGMEAVKFLNTPDGKNLARKFASGECRIEGAVAHPVEMMKFGKFLALR